MTEQNIQVCVVGLGYIGLPTAAVIADAGMRVAGVDISQHVVDTLNRGAVHIEERDLDRLVHQVVASGHLSASMVPAAADVFIIAVPTPFLEDGRHTPDISYVLAAARSIAPFLKPGDLVLLESTSPVGTTEALRDQLALERPDLLLSGDAEPEVAIAYCPERVLPGKIIQELRQNDRSIGGLTESCTAKAIAFYRRFVAGECMPTQARIAEMVKLTENAFRDVNIGFANELSMVADRMNLDVWEVIRLANRHPRVNILQPGPGVGGHCIAVDPWFIVHGAPEEARLIRAAREVNDRKCDYVLARCRDLMLANGDLNLGCLGLAFKPNIDDFRESPALSITAALAGEFGKRIAVIEPHASEPPPALQDSGARWITLDDAMASCDAFVLLVDHDEFKQITPEQRAGKVIYDTRGAW